MNIHQGNIIIKHIKTPNYCSFFPNRFNWTKRMSSGPSTNGPASHVLTSIPVLNRDNPFESFMNYVKLLLMKSWIRCLQTGSFASFMERMLIRPVTDFIYPPLCLLCEQSTDGEILCRSCSDKLSVSARVRVQAGTDFPYLAGHCFFDRVITCWPYSPELEQIVHWIKYRRGTRLGFSMGVMIGHMLAGTLEACKSALCIPVPLHRTRQRERGFNQSEVLVRGLSSTLGCQVDVTSLIRLRYTATQTRLSGPERRKNVQDAFKVKAPGQIKGRHILLVDDVCTTGATLNSCSCALKESGAETVTGIALARPQIVKDAFLP